MTNVAKKRLNPRTVFVQDQRLASAMEMAELLEGLAEAGAAAPLTDPNTPAALLLTTQLTEALQSQDVDLCAHVKTSRYLGYLCWLPDDGLACKDCTLQSIVDRDGAECRGCGRHDVSLEPVIFQSAQVIILAEFCAACMKLSDDADPRRK